MLNSITQSQRRNALMFLAPALLVLIVVAGWPLLRTLYFSFTDASLARMEDAHFVGFHNYLHYENGRWGGILAQKSWWSSVKVTFVFTFWNVSLTTIFGLGLALLMNVDTPIKGLLRTSVLVPWAIPVIISAKIWTWMFNDQYGVINEIMIRLNLMEAPIAWLADNDLAMAAIIVQSVWKTTPFMALMCLAALQVAPKDIYEVAAIDGVSRLKVFFRVTLPIIGPAVIVAMIFRTMDSLRVFEIFYVMSSNSEETTPMTELARRLLIDNQQVGLGSAASVLITLIVGISSAIYLTAGRVQVS